MQKNPFWTPSGSGYANSNVYREEINPTRLAELWSDILSGEFRQAHVGMHYTASSGRNYWFADADYFLGGGDNEMTFHHMLVIEDECQRNASHHTSDTTSGGAQSSDIYTSVLPTYQSELEEDFGASHIKEARLLLSDAVSGGVPSSWSWVGKKSFLMNMPMVFGHYLQLVGNPGEMFNGGNRLRQCTLFRTMPETIIPRRNWWWVDDVVSATSFCYIDYNGRADHAGASYSFGIRRAFLIG